MGKSVEHRPLSKAVGKIISEKRKRMGLSQEDLAERVGISQESLSRMEKGAIAPKFERLQSFAEALDCQVADLFLSIENDESEHTRHIIKTMSGLPKDAQSDVVDIVKKVVKLMR